MSSNAPASKERVLSTLNVDGSRRWLRPKLSKGRLWRWRRNIAIALIVLFSVLPHLRIGGAPVLMLDLLHARFTIFGTTFHGTETALLMMLMLTIFFGIFLVTAELGRAWCGWACPQTVYQEFLFRPLARWIEGGRSAQIGLDREGPNPRRFARYFVFFGVSAFLAHTFLGYFVPSDQLANWMTSSPTNHPVAFLIVAITTTAIFIDFTWFREQTCLVACPYGRLQSVLLDRHSWIVGYEPSRGENRGTMGERKKASDPEDFGDCIDCFKCVTTCPTGIDIRGGLQMECIHCTQCIDACDEVMLKIGKPTGLIRYTSKAQLAGDKRRLLRPRVIAYTLLILTISTTLALTLARRQAIDMTLLRVGSSPFVRLPDGRISNPVRIRLANRGGQIETLRFVLEGEAEILGGEHPRELQPGNSETLSLIIAASAGDFENGFLPYSLSVEHSDGTVIETIEARLLGPLGPGEAMGGSR